MMCLFPVCAAHGEKLRITTSSGAKVEINGVPLSTTPFEKDYPGGYFHKTKTVVGSRRSHPLAPAAEWISLKGRNYGPYWLFKTDHFDVKLDLLLATFTGGATTHTPAGGEVLAPNFRWKRWSRPPNPPSFSCRACKK